MLQKLNTDHTMKTSLSAFVFIAFIAISAGNQARAQSFSTTTISLGPGNGSVSLGTNSVAVGDLNGDGNPDLVVASYDSSSVSVLLGSGDGGFGTATTIFVSDGVNFGPVSVAIGDLNGDGKLDVATTLAGSTLADPNCGNCYAGKFLAILFGNGDGSFGVPGLHPVGGYEPYSIAIGDLNGDGRPDVVTANRASDNVSVILGDGFGNAAFMAGPVPYPNSVAIGDLDGDGTPDLVAAGYASPSVSVLLGIGDGSFGAPSNLIVGPGPQYYYNWRPKWRRHIGHRHVGNWGRR